MITFPDNSQITDNKFPYPEGYEWEYKQSYPTDHHKVYETICAMLNHTGGYIVIGIHDNLTIVGVPINKEFDNFVRKIDNIFHNKQIITDNCTLLDNSQITHSVKKINNKNVLAIKITKVEGVTYQLRSGAKYERLGASNIRVSVPQFYSDDTVAQMLNDLKIANGKEITKLQQVFAKIDKEKESKIKNFTAEVKNTKQSVDKITKLLFDKILREKEEAEKYLENKWFCVF